MRPSFILFTYIFFITPSYSYWFDMEKINRHKDSSFEIIDNEIKTFLCDMHALNKKIILRKFNTREMFSLSGQDLPPHGSTWNEMDNPQKEMSCMYGSRGEIIVSKDLPFRKVQKNNKYMICNEFKKDNNLPHSYTFKISDIDKNKKWYDMNFNEKKALCSNVYTKSRPITWEEEKEIGERKRRARIDKMLKSFDESEIRFQKKVAQFNEEFKATVERISSKSKNFNIEFKESKEKFKEKNIAILEDIEKSYKKKHKMKEIADSFAYVFSYGVFGTKNKCTIPSICDESLSRTERFMNFFKEMNAEDEKIQKQRDKEFTEDIKNRIERIKQL